ncbi:MAG: PKD domain-containing protein [Bacteroidales bacterium]|nr:PKD domain-containing protein [Bacteroidales bacterium]
MKKLLVLFASALLLITNTAIAQISTGGKPVSFVYKNLSDNIGKIEIPAPNMELILQEDNQAEKNGSFYKIGRYINADINLMESGTWTELPDGGKIFRISLKCEGAEALNAVYSDFYLPENTVLYIYNKNKKHVIGGFTDFNNRDDRSFVHEIVQGDEITLEYYQPAGVDEMPSLNIEQIGYTYRSSHLDAYKDVKDFGGSDNCQVNANCSPEGDNWQNQKRGAVRILLTVGTGMGWCSGSVINNTNEDCTPYILTADHCGNGATVANLNQWIFYFNYEAPTCSNPSSEGTLANQSMTGCALIAHGGDEGDAGSDFFLVELNEEIPDSYQPYYNGWNREDVAATSGVSIHHPSGDIKKISTFTSTLVTASWSGTYNAHWRVTWAATTNGYGVTEGGSSGSPIFNQAGLIVGDLTGGSSYCTATSSPDLYGKFSYSWESNGTTDGEKLKPWLDPANTGVMSLNGKDFSTCGIATITVTGTATGVSCWGYNDGSIDISASGGTPPYSYVWSHGPTTEDVSGLPAGNYSVTVTDSENVTGTQSFTVNAGTPIEIAGTITEATAGECDGAIDITVTPAGSYTFYWSNTSTIEDLTNLCPDSYFVVVTDANGCDTSATFVVVEEGVVIQADFSGTPTSIMVTESVNFTDASYGSVTSWNWTFTGGTPGTSTDQNPTGIVYNTPGSYAVSLEVSDGTNNDTETKNGYIVVSPSTATVPVADFMGNPTTIPVGGSVDFTDLSDNVPTSWVWEFEGADVGISTDQHPAGITYSTAGFYFVKLKVTNSAGSDSLTKIDYIAVVLDTSSTAPIIDFDASVRLISTGETVDFTDLSANYPISWTWTFNGGTPNSSTDQHPLNISYNTPGIYSVTLAATNSAGTSSLTKTDYIVVTDFPTAEICDTITNVMTGEGIGYKSLTSTWGYLPGHNGKFVTAYADRIENYMFSQVTGFLYPVHKANNGGGKVVFTVWNEDGSLPDSILGTKNVNVSAIGTNLVNLVMFNSPVPVDGIFYIGYQISYAYPDTVVISMANDRGPGGVNTLYCRKDGNWQSATDLFGVSTSSGMRVLGCVTDIQIIEFEDNMALIYPNPSSGIFTIDLSAAEIREFDLKVFDITGKLIDAKVVKNDLGIYELNLENSNSGIYFIKMIINGNNITRKVSLVK